MVIQDGGVYYINFEDAQGGEINKIHLAVLFNIKGVKNVVFVVPLTSPKEKHFTSEQAFKQRNYREVKFARLHYIVQTDSIALFEQFKSISVTRILKTYNNGENKPIVLNTKELNLLKKKIIRYISYILYK